MKHFLNISGLVLIACSIGLTRASPAANERRVKRQSDDLNAITSDYEYYDAEERQGRADEGDDGGDYDYEPQDESEKALGLPADSRSIRDNLVDVFECDGRPYGYYADIANECQLFHICYPVTYADGEEEMLHWTMICPGGTVFDQSTLVCAHPQDALPCEDSEAFMSGPSSINARFGQVEDSGSDAVIDLKRK